MYNTGKILTRMKIFKYIRIFHIFSLFDRGALGEDKKKITLQLRMYTCHISIQRKKKKKKTRL